jgi:hypothetical protein
MQLEALVEACCSLVGTEHQRVLELAVQWTFVVVTASEPSRMVARLVMVVALHSLAALLWTGLEEMWTFLVDTVQSALVAMCKSGLVVVLMVKVVPCLSALRMVARRQAAET